MSQLPRGFMNDPENFHCDFCQDFNIQTMAIFGHRPNDNLVKSGDITPRFNICHTCSILLVGQLTDTWTDKLLGL